MKRKGRRSKSWGLNMGRFHLLELGKGHKSRFGMRPTDAHHVITPPAPVVALDLVHFLKRLVDGILKLDHSDIAKLVKHHAPTVDGVPH